MPTRPELEAAVKDSGQPSWAALLNRRGNLYRNDNPKLPTLDPWVLRVKPPADRLVFVRNPYYYRVDARGSSYPISTRSSSTWRKASSFRPRRARAKAICRRATSASTITPS